jgi:hypothetical protein
VAAVRSPPAGDATPSCYEVTGVGSDQDPDDSVSAWDGGADASDGGDTSSDISDYSSSGASDGEWGSGSDDSSGASGEGGSDGTDAVSAGTADAGAADKPGSGKKWQYACPGGQFGAKGTDHPEEWSTARSLRYLAEQDLAAHVSTWPSHAGIANVVEAQDSE